MHGSSFSLLEAILISSAIVVGLYLLLWGVARISKKLHKIWPAFPQLLDGL